MKRVLLAVLAGALLAACPGAQTPGERARSLHQDALVIDTHFDTLQRVLMGGEDITRPTDRGHVDLPRMREGGLDAAFFAVWIDSPFTRAAAVKRTLQLIDAMHQVIERSGGQMRLATTASEIEQNAREGVLSALLGIEGGACH